MGVFGKSKKAKDAQADGSIRTEGQHAPSKMSRSLKRKQKNAPEPEPEMNIALALPDNNDFRTSLILPGLSARFSMLREQNDPNTKIGKANDDSVLFPSRASRLNLFQHNPLTDIAEVESIYSFRPPFAGNERSNSISEGYASDDGSIMNRTKPGEGNNLFSGRQKLYKVPNGTSSSTALSDSRPSNLGGRHVYSNDVTASMFHGRSQSSRQSTEDLNIEQHETMPAADTDETDNTNSPSTPFSKNRGTTSSTTSGPSNGRTSTAATSIASESPAMRQNSTSGANPLNRTFDHSNGSTERIALQKRPYVQNLDQSAPDVPPVNDILTNSTYSRAQSGPKHSHKLSQSRSMTTLKELNTSQPSVFATSAFRAASPPLTAPLRSQTDNATREETRSPSPRYRAISPTVGLGESDGFMTYNSNVQPGDRGKATALGLFNKPQRQFDEQQFSQRQMQMQEGRMSPPNRDSPSQQDSRVASPEEINSSREDFVKYTTARSSSKLETPASSDLNLDDRHSDRVSPVPADRSSKPSPARPVAITRPRTKSSSSTAKSALIEARTHSLIRRQNEELASELATLEAQRSVLTSSERQRASQRSVSKSPMMNGTFFDTLEGSSDDSESVSPEKPRQSSHSRHQPQEVHPALRDGLNDFIFDDSFTSPKLSTPRSPYQSATVQADHASPSLGQDFLTPIPSPSEEKTEDSPTLPIPGLGLSGLVRAHLRNDSDKSSLYPQPNSDVPAYSAQEATRKVSTSTERTVNPPESIRSDPWELDNVAFDNESPRKSSESQDPRKVMSQKARQILGQARALNAQPRSKAQQILGQDAPDGDVPQFEEPRQIHPWLEDRKPSHQREFSSSTQKERQEFDEELAERRRKVQQKLKGVVDSEGRSMSPAPGYGRSQSRGQRNAGYPFPDQRAEQYLPEDQYDQHAPKAMKMLGIQGPPKKRQASPRVPQDNLWKDEEDQMLRDYGRPPKQRSPPADEDYRHRQDRSNHPGAVRNGSAEEIEHARQRSTTPNSGRRAPGRSRANSEFGNRSRSRTGTYREDEERNYGRPHDGSGRPYGSSRSPHDDPYYRGPSRGPGDRAPSRGPGDRAPSRGPVDPRSYDRSTSAASGRYRSNSRPSAPGYIDNRPPPIMPPANGNMPFRQPRPAPQPSLSQETPTSPHPTQRPFDSSSSPAPSAMNSPTVPSHGLSSTGRTTPTSTGRTTPNMGNRKKSVTKNMISEPTFLSSTSSVPLVGLDDVNATAAIAEFSEGTSPPVPVMNPRRRRGTANTPSGSTPTSATGPAPHNPFQFLRPDLRPSKHDVSNTVPVSPMSNRFGGIGGGEEHTLSDDNAVRAPRQRNRLRKTSSEGGSMAAKSRNQAILGELRGERVRSPAVSSFAMQGSGGRGIMGGGVGGGMAAGSRMGMEREVGVLRGVREGEMF